MVRSLFKQQELGERSVNWVTSLQGYDLEFKPVHTIKGHGLCRLTAKAIDSPEEESSRWEQDIEMYNIKQATPTNATTSWYTHV